jgi:hypothetical protein
LEATRPDGDVVVRIRSDQGVYFDQTVIWSYHNPMDMESDEYNISFEPYPDSLYACFIGSNADTTFFILDRRDGKPTNVHFRKLSIRAYVHGTIWFCGNRAHASGWNGYNSIDNCIFQDVGNFSQPEQNGCYGVLDFMNARYNIVRNCIFFNCANANTQPYPQKEEAGMLDLANLNAIVGIYLAHHSGNNYITENTFQNIKGDPVRIRDVSNDNEICFNKFYKSGWAAICTMWYCHPNTTDCLPTPDGLIDECPSYGTIFRNNKVEGNWICGLPRLFKDIDPNSKFGCSPNSEPRIQLYNNVSTECRGHVSASRS